MQIFDCGSCGKKVFSHWVEPTVEQKKRGKKARWEPDSHYWKADGINDIEEVYCGALCGLDKYQVSG